MDAILLCYQLKGYKLTLYDQVLELHTNCNKSVHTTLRHEMWVNWVTQLYFQLFTAIVTL